MEIVIASTNLHKIREFRDMLKNFKSLDVLSLHNFPTYQPPPETGASFQENAILKARHAANTLNKMVLADDSGLVVPAINGAPGIHSRRYAGDDATDAENRLKLLNALINYQDSERSAYYECCLAVVTPNGIEKTASGICEGRILTEEKGRNGFGYDSLFVKHEYDKTFAEIDELTKNRISHRQKAFSKISIFLQAQEA